MNLNYKVSGQGSPVIILHGLLGSLDNWQSISRQLSTQFRVFRLDLRNHGKSPHSPVHDYPSMSDDLLEFLDRHQIHYSHIIGHSMGGKTALWFALHHPQKINRLIVVDIGIKKYPPEHDLVFKALNTIDPAGLKNRGEAETQLKKLIPQPAIRQFLLKNLDRQPQGAFKWKMNLKALYENYSNMLTEITGSQPFTKPTLFISGGRSPYLSNGDKPGILKLFPLARFTVIKNAGHWVHAEAPQQFLDVVRQFLLTDNGSQDGTIKQFPRSIDRDNQNN